MHHMKMKTRFLKQIMEPMKRLRLIIRKCSKLLIALLVALPFLVLAMMVYKEPILHSSLSSKATSHSSETSREDRFLGGLLSSGFSHESCISRYTSYLYHNTSPHRPSSFLLSKLRNYEKLHKLCGPNSKLYNESLQLLSGSRNKSVDGVCKYVVWIAYSGLGNRILTIASAFLYALVTNRVLLIQQQSDMVNLFCEPFPDTSWLLPKDFPLRKKLSGFDQKHGYSYGNLLKRNMVNSSLSKNMSYLYVHLGHDYDDHDKLFYCDEHQLFLRNVDWLIMRTDNYFVPSLFLMETFEQELMKLFPNHETVFHHLGRYLFHPSNQAWGLITRYYHSSLSKADERIGLQIRVIDTVKSSIQVVKKQVLACIDKEKLLPETKRNETDYLNGNEVEKNKKKISKAVLITSLYSVFYEKIKSKYLRYPTVNGEVVSVYQPSHEEEQKYENNMHNMKAWSEMYLLSMCDVLMTSGWSTFGYVAQGLGGMKPWILYRFENKVAPDPPCGRVLSMEPCFHSPPIFHCKARKYVDYGALVPYVRHCEDMSWGLKLFESH